MKTNYLTLSVMALAAAFTACSQDNEIPETNVSDNAQALTIQATESGFEAAEKEGRATDDGKTTVFEDGDKMGLFVVRDNGSVVKSNEPITYNGTTWTTTTPVYYYTDADYIAYFPYDADLSVSETTTTDITAGIISAFDTYFEEHKADQSDLKTYRNADLMLSTITAEDLAKQTTENKTLNFALKHNYSMIELNIPSHKYSYTYGEGTKEFSVPMSNFVVKLGEEPVTPCHIGNGVYRMLVEPGEINLEGSFEDPKDQRPVNFDNSKATTKSLTAGRYVKYNISYEGAPSGNAEERDIIGDYYCQDGSIYPSDFQAVPDNVIGIIYSTVDGDEFKDEGYQYYVLSIKERKQIGFYVNKEIGSMTDDEKTAAVKDIADIAHFDAPTADTYSTFAGLTDMSGYAATTALRALTPAYSIITDLENNWVNNDTYAAPATGTTGWFIPSIGQLVKLHDILGESGAPAWTWTNSLMSSNTTGAQAQQKFVSLLERVLPENETDSRSFNKCTWSITQVTATEGNSEQFCIEIGSNKFQITTKPKTDRRSIRPILAF